MIISLLILQATTPGDCLLTGLCGLVTVDRPVAPGWMWLAMGLVVAGAWGLRRVHPRP